MPAAKEECFRPDRGDRATTPAGTAEEGRRRGEEKTGNQSIIGGEEKRN